MANPFSDPFTHPDIEPSTFPQTDFGLPPATPRMSAASASAPVDAMTEPEPSFAQRTDDVTDDADDLASVEPYRSPYAGMNLLSEPMDKERGPTAFQRKEINWADGGEDLSRPRLRGPAPKDWLEVDYSFGRKEGATDAPVEAANVFGRQFTRDELMRSESGRELLDLMQMRRSGKVSEGGAIPNFVRGFLNWGVSDIPYYGWFADIGATVGDAIRMSKTVRKLQDGEKVSNEEAIKLRGYMLRQELESQRTMAYNVGSTVRSSVTLGAEILASSAVGAGIGLMLGGVGAPVGAVVGALLTPLRWAFGIGGSAAKAGARKVVNRGMEAVAKKAAKDLTAGELRETVRVGSEIFGRDGVRSFLREGVESGLRGKELYSRLAGELQYATKLRDPSRMATRALFNADYRHELEEGLRLAVEKQVLSRMQTSLTKKSLEKMTARERRALVNEGIREMVAGNRWDGFVKSFSKGVLEGKLEGDRLGRTALDIVRQGVADTTGRQFVAPQYARRMLDTVIGNVTKDMELASGRLAFANPVRYARFVGEHLARGLVQSEWGLLGGAPNIAHHGLSTFARGTDALKEGIGRVFVEAPVQGALQFLGGPIALSPIIAAASGESWGDLRVKGQLGTEIDALVRGDRDKLDAARACALGSAFVEYASEAAGRGLAPMVGGALATVLRKSPKAVSDGARNISYAVSRKSGAALDRAITAVFGEGNLLKEGTEGLVRQSSLALQRLPGARAVRATIARVVQSKSIDGFDDATKRALAKRGVTSYGKFKWFVSQSAAEGQRLRGAVNFLGAAMMERGWTPDRIVQLFRKGGVGGILEEMGEERVGDFMRGLFGFDDTASDATWKDKLQSAFSGFADPEQLATELIAFAIPGAIRRTTIGMQGWLAHGAVGRTRMAAQGLDWLTNIGHGRVYASVPVGSQEAKERLERFPEESRRMRDETLGTTEANRARIGANAAAAYARAKAGALRDDIAAAGGLSSEGIPTADAKTNEGLVSQVLGATSEGHMKAAMEELADFYLGLGDEARLETALEQTGATAIFGADGVDAIRREWRKGEGRAFAEAAATEGEAEAPGSAIERSLAAWKDFDANPPTVTAKEVASPEEAVEGLCAQVEGLRPNAALTGEAEERAQGGSGEAVVADENARDFAVEDGMTLGRFLGRAAFNADVKMSFGRRCVSRALGILGAAATGDLSLAATNPAAWLANDYGIDKNLQMALQKCFAAGIMAGWARKLASRSTALKDLVGEVKTPEELREKLSDLYRKGQVSADLFRELEELGEDTFRARVTDLMSAYVTASGVALVTRQDALDMARSVVATRHERRGESFERSDEWYAQDGIAQEVEDARAEIVNGVIRTMRESVGYTTHRGQGDYGSYMTVDVMRAIRSGTSAEVLAAILDSPAFRGVARVGNISFLSEHDRELATSALTSDNGDVAAVARIRTEGEMRADGTYADRDLTERELAEVNSLLRANPADYTPEAFQNLARTFVRRLRLARENSRSTFRKMNEDGDYVTVRVVPTSGGFTLVESVEGSDIAPARTTRSFMGGTREGVESYLESRGFAADEQRIVISQLHDFASVDATSILFMRNGQDREAVRRLFADPSGLVQDEAMLPPFCRKERRDAGGPLVWKFADGDSAAAAALARREFELAEEYDRNRDSWRYYLPGTKATEAARKARMAEAKKMFLRVYGVLEGGKASGGYETRAREMVEALGIRRNVSTSTAFQQVGLPSDAYLMPVDAVLADNVLVLAPDYFTLGHGEALLRNGLRLALNAYVAGEGEEFRSRCRLLAEAYREFRACADELVAEAASGPGGKAEAERLAGVFREMLPVRETGVSTYDLAKMASSAVFFSCDRGNYEEGNGFLHSVELSQVADRFRSKDAFPFFLSAIDEALGGRGAFNPESRSLDGLARYIPAYAPDFAKLAAARASAAFGGKSGDVKLPFVTAFRLREGVTADMAKGGEARLLEQDPSVGRKDEATGRLRVASFDGKVAGYWDVIAASGQALAGAYGKLAGGTGYLTSAQAFEMARRSDFCGGETRTAETPVTGDGEAANRPQMSDVVRRVARKAASRPLGVDANPDITPAAVECAGQAIRGVFANLALLPKDKSMERKVKRLLAEDPNLSRREAERQVRESADATEVKELRGWLMARGVPPNVIASMLAAYDDAVLHPVRRKTDEEIQNEIADRTNEEDEAHEADESTNDIDHSRRTAMAVTDQNAISVAGFLRFVMPSENGDSSPTFARLRAELSRDEMYEGVPEGWESDIEDFKSLMRTGSDLLHYGESLAKVRSAVDSREDVDRMLDRVSAVLWQSGRRDYALAVAAIRNVDRGARETVLAILSQSVSTTPVSLVRSEGGKFDIRTLGSYAKADLVPRIVASGYTSLAESALSGVFRPSGTRRLAKDAAASLAKLVVRLRGGIYSEVSDLLSPEAQKADLDYVDPIVQGGDQFVPGTIPRATYKVLLDVAVAGPSTHTASEYVRAVMATASLVRHRMANAAAALDRLLGVGNQYSAMLRSPAALDRLSLNAYAVYSVKDGTRRKNAVNDLVSIANWLVAGGKRVERGKVSWTDRVRPDSGIVEDLYVEPILGLVRRLGIDPEAYVAKDKDGKPVASDDGMTGFLYDAAKLEDDIRKALDGEGDKVKKDAEWLRGTLRQMAKDKVKFDLHLDLGADVESATDALLNSAARSKKGLGVKFTPGAPHITGNLLSFVGNYLAGMPRSSATLGGLSANAAEAAKLKTPQTLPSQVPAFVRFANSELARVSGVVGRLSTNGWRWGDGSNPLVSFVGAKDADGTLLPKYLLGGLADEGAVREFTKEGSSRSHVTVPLFHADKPSCYAIRIPTAAAEQIVVKGSESEEVMRPFVGANATLGETIRRVGAALRQFPGVKYVNHSGGADGSDTAWGEAGAKYGVKSRHYYHKAKTPKGNVDISQVPGAYEEGVEKYKAAAQAMGKRISTKEYILNLMARNWQQAKNADAVFAIGQAGGTAFSGNDVSGGTGYAVQMAKAEGKPVHVFDQGRKAWFTWDGTKWVQEGTPTLTPNFAGIGTRELTDAGRKAIDEVYEKSLGKAPDAKGARPAYTPAEFYDSVYALVASAVGQSQIDPKRVPVLSSVGPVISTWLNEGEKTDPRAGCYFVSNVCGETGAQMMGGYLTAGVLASRVSGYGGGAWSQAQKLHMFSIARGVNFKKGQASAIGLGFYADGRADDGSANGEIASNGAVRHAQMCGRRALERVLKDDLKAAGVTKAEGSLDPVPPLKEGATAEETSRHSLAADQHDRAVRVANAFLKKATVAVDDLETNKAGLFGSSCGIEVPEGATTLSVNGVEIMHVEDGEWKSSVRGFNFDFDGEGVKNGRVLVAPALAALAVATGKEVDASAVAAKWLRPDGSSFEGTLGESGLLGEGETLRFEPDAANGGARMTFFTREIYGQVVANNANSSKGSHDHIFPTNATRDHWMIEELTNAIAGGARKSAAPRRFVDATAGYSLLQLANLAHNPTLLAREIARDEDLAALFAAHPDDIDVRDAVTSRVKAFAAKQVIAGWFGAHGVMVPSGGKLVKGDEFGHVAHIEWAPGTTDYDRDCYKHATPYMANVAEAFGTSRSWASGAVNADVEGFRYGLYFDEAALDELLADVEVGAEEQARLFGLGFDRHAARIAKLAEYLKGLKGPVDSVEKLRKYDALMDCAYDYTGRKASENARKGIRFDDLFYRTWDGEERFDYAAIDFEGRTSKHDGQRHLYLGGSIFHAHRSPSGNIAAASGTVRASCPVSYFADGRIGRESKYALDPVTTATQGSDTDGDSASLQFYDYSAKDRVDETAMRRFTDAVLSGRDAFDVAREMGWLTTVDGLEVVDPEVLRSVERLLFVAQANNYREAPTIHIGYTNANVGIGRVTGADFAEYYSEENPDSGFEFCDYGFAMRHPVGTDAVFAEPFTPDTLRRFNNLLSKEARAALGRDFAQKWFMSGRKMNKVFSEAVDRLRGKPTMNLLDHASVAATSDAASDSVKSRGIAVANQATAQRVLLLENASMLWDEKEGYSPFVDLIAHLDGISNNLFDTLKKMFATRAEWTANLLPVFLGKLVYDSSSRVLAPQNRLDSAFILAEALNFIEEATRTGPRGEPVTVLGRYAALLDPRRRNAVAHWLYLQTPGVRDEIEAQRAKDLKTADEVIDWYANLKKNGETLKKAPQSVKTLYAAAYLGDLAAVDADEGVQTYSQVLKVSDDGRDLVNAIDHMKAVGKPVEQLAKESDPVTITSSAVLQSLVVDRFFDLVARNADSTELLQAAVDNQIGLRPWRFETGSGLRENYRRFNHLVGAARRVDPTVLERVSTLKVDRLSARSTATLLRRVAATAAYLSDRASRVAGKQKLHKDLMLNRFLSSLAVQPRGVTISLDSRVGSQEMEDIREGFDVLARSGDLIEICERDKKGNAVLTGVKVKLSDFADLLILHASLMNPFAETRDYLTQSNLPAAFGDRRLRELEKARPEILSDPRIASALGLKEIRVDGSPAYDLFGSIDVRARIGESEARDTVERLTRESTRRTLSKMEQKSLENLRERLAKSEGPLVLEGRGTPLQIFTTPAKPIPADYAKERADVRLINSRRAARWADPSYDPVRDIFENRPKASDVAVGSIPGFSVEADSLRSGASLVDRGWADPLTTCTEFRRPGETDAAAVFVQPSVDREGRATRHPKAYATSLEAAVNGYLADVTEALKGNPERAEARQAFLDLNPNRRFLTATPARVARDVAGILAMSARRDPALYDALDAMGDRLAQHPDPRIAAAFNLVNSRLGQDGRDGILRTEAGSETRASFMGGDTVNTDPRFDFAHRAERLSPGFTALQARSVKEAVKGALEGAFDDVTVTDVTAKDGSETNLLKVTRNVAGRKIVTYVSYGSRMGDALGAKAAADSLAEWLNARAGQESEKVTGESLLRRLGEAGVTRLADIMRRTGGMMGESVVGGFDFAPAMSGLIRLSEHASFTTLFHEYYHQMVAVYRKLGILDKATEDDINARLGGEERAAESFGRYVSGVAAGADEVELRDFLKADGVTAKDLATFERFREYALAFARAAFRGTDPDSGAPVFVAVKIVRGDLTEEEAAKIAEPSAADVANLENELVGAESRPRLDLLTGEQMTRALDVQLRVADHLLKGEDAEAKKALKEFENSLAPVPKIDTRPSAPDVAVSEALEARQEAEALSTVSYFIRRAMGRYAKDGRIEGFEESMRLYREFPVTGDAATGPNAALFYTVRSFIAHVAEAEGVDIYGKDGKLNRIGEALMSSGTVGELAMRFVNCAEADRAANPSDRSLAEHASSSWAFSRALQAVAPGAYTRYCRRLAERSAEAFRRLGETILARADKTPEDIEAANEFLARADEVGKFVDYIARGQSIKDLLPFRVAGSGNLHGMFMVYFAGSARFERADAGKSGEYLYPKGPVRPYSRDLPHTNVLGTSDKSLDPLVDLAYNYAAQAFSVAEAARSYRQQVLGRGKDEADPETEENLEGAGLGEADPFEVSLTDEEVRAVDSGLEDTLGVSVAPSAELAAQLDAEARPLDVNASTPATEPAQFFARVDTTSTTPEWILANEGMWLASDMQHTLSGVGMREMMTDHSIRAVTEKDYRLAMDFLQLYGLDTHEGDPVRAIDFVESRLGRNEEGDFAIDEENAHTAMRFSRTRGALLGIFNWQEKRVGEPITKEDLRELHAVGRLVRLIASRSERDLTGIEVGFLAANASVDALARDDYRTHLSFESIMRRLTGPGRYQLTAVEDLLRRIVDSIPASVVEDSADGKGLYSTVLDELHEAVVKAGAGAVRPNAERLNDALVHALEKAGVAFTSGAGREGVKRTVVSVSVSRMAKAWERSDARRKLVKAGRPAQMLNPYYWGAKFAKAVVELNDVASRSNYITQGEGARFTLAGTRRFWWHGGTGSHKFQVEAYQNAQRAFEGLTPSGVDALRAKYREIFDIMEASQDPKALQRRAFSESGMTSLSDRELRYLAYLMGLTSRDAREAKFDLAGFARDIAKGAYETYRRDVGVPCTISRNATVLDVRLLISDLASRKAFGDDVPGLPVQKRQEYLNAVTVSDMLRDALQREVPAKITALNECEVFSRTGRLGDSRTAAESLIEMCKELTTAERFRGCLAQMLTSLSADGTPAFVVAPTDAALGVNRMPDEYWGALARHVVKFLGQKFPTLSYDAGLSGAENMRRIHAHLVEGNQRLYGKLSTAKYGGDRLFQGDILCRLDDRDAAGNVDEATRLMGGEAANYMKQLLSTLRAPTQHAAWRILDALSSWSKISSVGFSAFFQIATAFESPVAATGFLKTLAGQAEWLGKAFRRIGGTNEVFTRDLVRLLNSNDAFLTEARELCDLIGMPLDSTVDFTNDPNDSNPVLGNAVGIRRDIERISAFVSRTRSARAGKALRKSLEFLYKHPTDYTFNVVLNGVKMAVVMQTVRRLREECLRGGRPFDLVKELRKYAGYINAEIGGIDPAKYAWATPGMRKVLSLAMFSWQWTVGAWSAGGGEAVSDLVFGGHATSPALRRHALLRWIRMFGIVKFGVPAVMQAAIKALAALGLRALPPDPDDEPDSLEQEVDEMPWWTFNNESKAGMLAFDVTPILKLAARVPALRELKRADIPVISWAVPAYVGGGRNTTGRRHYYMHFGKQSDEFWRWFEDPLSQFISKLSIPLQKGAEGIFGQLSPNGFRKSFADRSFLERFFTLSLDPDESATANFLWSMISSFSLESMKANADAGIVAAVGPMRMGQSKRSTMMRIAERVRKFAEDDRTGNPWSYRRNRRKFNLLCTDILREAQWNGVPPAEIMSAALGEAAHQEYKKFFAAFPPRLDGAPDVKKMQEAVRGLTRLNRKYADIRSYLVQKFKASGTDLKANRAYYQAVRDTIRATQNSPFLFGTAEAEERFDRYLTRPKTAVRSTDMDERGGEVFGNFLATDEVPKTLFGIPVVTDNYTEEDIEFFTEHPEAGGFYDLGETPEGDPTEPEPPEPASPKGAQAVEGGGTSKADEYGERMNAAVKDVLPFLRKHEGFRPNAYLDTQGVPTIGYGQTEIDGRPVTMADRGMTEADAARWMERRVRDNAVAMYRRNPWMRELSRGALAAAYDLAYNMGDGIFSRKNSRGFNRRIDAGERPEDVFWSELPSYIGGKKATPKTRKGLKNRREDAIRKWRK